MINISEETIKRIDEAIQYAIEYKEELNASSWRLKEGILISVNEAIAILKLVESERWIPISERKPEPGTEVLIITDYSKFGRGKVSVELARVHFSEKPIDFGGPRSLSGIGKLTGTYFSIPAILNPEVVTHWKQKPELPKK